MAVKKDLVVLTADKDAHLGIAALMNRQGDLGVRPIAFECVAHPKHDSGVLVSAHHFLRPFLRYFDYSLVVFDLEGCGQEDLGREGVERRIKENLAVKSTAGSIGARSLQLSLSWNAGFGMSRCA
jgi:hypothetical protein